VWAFTKRKNSSVDLNSNLHAKFIETADDAETIKLFQNVLEFSSIKLKECAVPRTDLVTISITDTLDVLRRKFTDSGYSKILVYNDSIDDIIGYIHTSDLFKNPQSVTEIIRKILFVPETMNAKKLLLQLISQKQSIAVVIDEFGGTSGIVTIEDIIEEIFGEIKDEHDTINLEEKVLSNSEYVFSGRHEIDYINEKYNFDIPNSEEYETLAGFFLFYYQKFPIINASIVVENIKITILKISGTRIELIQLKKIEDKV